MVMFARKHVDPALLNSSHWLPPREPLDHVLPSIGPCSHQVTSVLGNGVTLPSRLPVLCLLVQVNESVNASVTRGRSSRHPDLRVPKGEEVNAKGWVP